MSKLKRIIIGGVVLAIVGVGCGPGGVGGDRTNDEGAAVFFSNGGFSIEATTTQTATAKRTTITEGGKTLVEMDVTVDGITLSFPTEATEVTTIVFNTPLDELPSELATNRLAAFVAGQLFAEGGAGLRQDNPGCDMFPDTRCTLRCCADHDRCYADNDCSFLSWIPNLVSPLLAPLLSACSNCNAVAASCIIRACATGSEGDPDSDVCFDAACGASYTCPPPNEFDCFACPSPCSQAPASCGNGSCEVTENAENCVSDCATGLGVNTCCQEFDNCPSETPTTCPGSCCCCGLGEVCGAGNVCVNTGTFKRIDTDATASELIEAKRRAPLRSSDPE